MSREDITDDTAAHAEVRAAADNASGWNGSLELYRPEVRQGTPCPQGVRERLQAARAAALQRAEQQRKQGLCL